MVFFLRTCCLIFRKLHGFFSNPKEMPVSLSGDMSKQFLAHFPLTNGGIVQGVQQDTAY